MPDRTQVTGGLYENAFGISILHTSFTEGVRGVLFEIVPCSWNPERGATTPVIRPAPALYRLGNL